MDSSLQGQTAWISGAGSGIGAAIATKLAQAGCNVYLVGRTEEKIKLVAESISSKVVGSGVDFEALDVGDKKLLQQSIDNCVSKFGQLTILVNNAGVACTVNSSLEKWDEVVDINLKSVMRATKFALPHLEEAAKLNLNPIVINISSVSGINYFGGLTPYCASKHGVVGFSGSLYSAVQNKGIRVSCINPGWVDTPMIQGLMTYDQKKCITPEQIAHTVYFVAAFPSGACPTEIAIWPQYQ